MPDEMIPDETIPEDLRPFFTRLQVSKTIPLQENNARLFLDPKVPVYRVKVDKGIVPNTEQKIKKCDYLLWDPNNKAIILIELKGTDIKSALDQLKESFPNICKNQELDFMTKGIKYLFACCATSHFDLPKNADEHTRLLWKHLKSRYRGTYKCKDGEELLIFVRGKPNKPNFTRTVIDNSNDYPLPIYPQIWEKYITGQPETASGKKYQHN